MDDFYGDFILNLILDLPYLNEINLSNLNLGDKFCKGFNSFIDNEKRFIDLEIMKNSRITNVGLKYLYVSYQILRNYCQENDYVNLPKLKVFKVKKVKKINKNRKKNEKKKEPDNLPKTLESHENRSQTHTFFKTGNLSKENVDSKEKEQTTKESLMKTHETKSLTSHNVRAIYT